MEIKKISLSQNRGRAVESTSPAANNEVNDNPKPPVITDRARADEPKKMKFGILINFL